MNSLSKIIRQKYELGDVYHLTDVTNLDSIIRVKTIFSHNQISLQKIDITDISNLSVQYGRANKIIDATGKPLHDYVPLYWGRKTPMVSAIREKNETLIFLLFSTNLLEEKTYECVISDGNARSNVTKFVKYSQLSDLDMLTPEYINTVKYASNEEIKRCKQSELLVLNKLPLKHMLRIVCYSPIVKSKVEALLTAHSVSSSVCIGSTNYYF